MLSDTTQKHSNNLSRHRRHKKISSTSSSDKHIDYWSEDDYLSNPSQIDIDAYFFDLDEDNNTIN
jgi:hypothetical protein